MKNTLLFLLLLMLPVCLLIWFGFKAQSSEQLATQQQYQNLAYSQLKLIDEKIISYFKQLETALIANSRELKIKSPQREIKSPQRKKGISNKAPSTAENYAQKIRQFIQYSPYILNIYISDKDQKTLYPSFELDLSEKERAFVSKIQVISRNRSLFNGQSENMPPSSNNRNTAISQKLSPLIRASQFQTDTAAQEHGWITWYQERNLNHLFWFKDEQKRIYILYLDRIKILSQIIALLPEKNSKSNHYSKIFQELTIRLTDSNNELIYEWGDYPANTNPSTSMMLSYPLSSWKLSWYAKALSDNTFKQKWSLLFIAVLASLLMLILMIIIYREYNRKLRQAQQRVNFVSQVSHELKTPLTNIRMYAELLEAKLDSNPEIVQSKARHFLNVIINESLRLSRLIENVLSFAKVQKETLRVNRTEGVIDECIDNTLLSFKPVLQQKQLSVQFIRNAGQPVRFDSHLLEQILNNLLSNIEKYAAQGKQIDICSSQTEMQATIELRDYGPGIAKSEQRKIFNSFYRSSSKLTEGVSGTGIGLTISQQLAILHGGSLSYKNVPEGACFVIQLDTTPEKNLQQKKKRGNK